jgi:tripartite-type tricarboxylate transporter receptor subunit TctC
MSIETRVARLGVGAALLGAMPAAHADVQTQFPSPPISLDVPWPAGGAADPFMHALGEAASRYPTMLLVIENRPGAGGSPGSNQLVQTAFVQTAFGWDLQVGQVPVLVVCR